MSRGAFYIAMLMAVLFAGLTLTETWAYKKWDEASAEQRDIQAKLGFGQRMKSFTDQFLRRVAIDSQHDPALAALLKKHKVDVVVSNPEAVTDQAQQSSSAASPAANMDAAPVLDPGSPVSPVAPTPTPSKS